MVDRERKLDRRTPQFLTSLVHHRVEVQRILADDGCTCGQVRLETWIGDDGKRYYRFTPHAADCPRVEDKSG
jgi:hypothetical protein